MIYRPTKIDMSIDESIEKYKMYFARTVIFFSSFAFLVMSIVNWNIDNNISRASILLAASFLMGVLGYKTLNDKFYKTGINIGILMASLVVSYLGVQMKHPDVQGAYNYFPVLISAAILLSGIRMGASL